MSSVISWDLLARDKASPAFRGLGDEVDRNTGKFSKWKGAVVAGAAVAGAALFKFAKDSVGAYVEAEQSQAQLEDAFKRFPNLADVNIDALRGFNSELAKKTRFDDDAYASGQAVLAQFGLTGKQLKDITPLAADFAAKTGRDLPDAAKLMGKAFLGNTRALKDLGIDYKVTGDKATDMANIQQLVNEKVGGFAEREGKTAAGQAAILKNQFGEVQETVGQKLVPVLTKLAGMLVDGITFMQEHGTATKVVVGVLGTFAAVVGTIITITKVWTAVQTAWNAVMAMNPIGLIIIAIALLAAGLVIAWKRSETFRAVVTGALDAVGKAFNWIVDGARAAFQWVGDKWSAFREMVGGWKQAITSRVSNLFDAIQTAWSNTREWVGEKWRAFKGFVDNWTVSPGELWSAIKTGWTATREWVGEKWAAFKEWVGGWAPNFSGMFNGIKEAFRSAVNTVIGWWNNLSFGIPGFDPPGPGPKFGGFSVGTPNIPMLAAGGIVTRPTLAMIGEAGPEAVIPLDRAGGFGGDVTATVQLVLDGQIIQQSLLKLKRNNGGVELGLE